MTSLSDELASVKTGYNDWAVVYDHDANPLPALEEPVVRKWVGDPAGLEVLDLGCGTGRHALWLAEAGASVTAVDFSPGMLAEARSKPGAERVQFVEQDLHQPLAFDANAFDLVVSGLVLEHIRELEPLFLEVHRVLKPTGRAVISAMHPAMFLRGSQARFTDPQSGETVHVGSLNHSFSGLVLSMQRAGFRLAHLEEFAPSHEFANSYPRAEKYIDYSMLVVFQLEPNSQ